MRHLLKNKKYSQQYGFSFQAGIGAEAIRELLKKIELEPLAVELRAKILATSSAGLKKKLTKRLRIVEAFRKSDNLFIDSFISSIIFGSISDNLAIKIN